MLLLLLPPGVPTRYRDNIFKTENGYAMVTRPVHAICDPAGLWKTAIGGTGENSISIFLNEQTREGLQTCVKSFVIIVWFSLSIQVIMLLQQNSQRSGFTNSLANGRSCVTVCASLKV